MAEVLYTFPGPKEKTASTGGSNFAALVGGIPQACQWLLWALVSVVILGAIATPTILAVTNLQIVEDGSGEQGSGSGEVSPPPPGDILMGDPSPGGVGADAEFVFSPSLPPAPPSAPTPAAPGCCAEFVDVSVDLCDDANPDIFTDPAYQCENVAVGDFCEASSVCGNNFWNNCYSGYDYARRVDCGYPTPPPSPPAPAAPECAIAGGLCPDMGTHTNPGLGDVDLGTEASSMHEDAGYREQCRALCETTQGCNYYSLQWSSGTGIVRCKLCANNEYYWGTYVAQAALYGACNPPSVPPPLPPPLAPRTAKVQAHPETLSLSPGACGAVRWTLDEPLIAVGEPGYLTLYLTSPSGGTSFTPDMLRWDQTTSWRDIQTVEVCADMMLSSPGTYTNMAGVVTNSEYYSNFVPTFVLSVAYR